MVLMQYACYTDCCLVALPHDGCVARAGVTLIVRCAFAALLICCRVIDCRLRVGGAVIRDYALPPRVACLRELPLYGVC